MMRFSSSRRWLALAGCAANPASGLGLKDAITTYYKRAVEAGKGYGRGGPFSDCEGFEVHKLVQAALGR